jgi:integrase
VVSDNHILAHRCRGGAVHPIIFGDQEKNEKRLAAQISPRSWRLLSLYCNHYRPAIPGADKTTLLFPARTRIGHTGPSLLGTAIRKLVKKRVKVDVTVDLWRHIMGTRLEERSERAGDGQRLLGHVSGSTSTKNYIRVSTTDAAKRLRKITDAVRGQGNRQLGYGKHRVRRRKSGGPTAPLARDR